MKKIFVLLLFCRRFQSFRIDAEDGRIMEEPDLTERGLEEIQTFETDGRKV